jgi:hypothetical protein
MFSGIHFRCQPSWFSPKREPDEGDNSDAQKHDRDRDQFDSGKLPWSHAQTVGGG